MQPCAFLQFSSSTNCEGSVLRYQAIHRCGALYRPRTLLELLVAARSSLSHFGVSIQNSGKGSDSYLNWEVKGVANSVGSCDRLS